MNTKVCGITQLRQLQQLDGLDIDFAGLIFYKDSPRYLGDKIAAADLKNSDFDLKKVGVFVNADYDEIMQVVEDYGLDVVQLHGCIVMACDGLKWFWFCRRANSPLMAFLYQYLETTHGDWRHRQV